jgi:hypothetical protein
MLPHGRYARHNSGRSDFFGGASGDTSTEKANKSLIKGKLSLMDSVYAHISAGRWNIAGIGAPLSINAAGKRRKENRP